jgi:hypothetical protein
MYLFDCVQQKKASQLYNVPRSTLRDKLLGNVPECYQLTGRKCVLGEKIEEELKD